MISDLQIKALFQDQEEGMVAGFSLRAILGYLNTDDQNGLQGKIEKIQ